MTKRNTVMSLSLLFLALLCGGSAFAQVTTIQIGTTLTYTGYYLPFYGYYPDQRSQIIYLASDINGAMAAAGLQAKSHTAGALRPRPDDYLNKPFEAHELLARIRALLRRGTQESSRLRLADLEMDTAARTVVRGGRRIDLKLRRNLIKNDTQSDAQVKARANGCLDRVERDGLSGMVIGNDDPRI